VDSWRIGDAGIQVTRCYLYLPQSAATAPPSLFQAFHVCVV